MTTGIVDDGNVEKQVERPMGCMSGFLQLFERNQRLYASTKRLPSTAVAEANSEPPEKSITGSPPISGNSENPQQPMRSAVGSPASPERQILSEIRSRPPTVYVETPPKSPLPLPIFELKGGSNGIRSSWKFCKEAPRLSLDSRATVDAKGSLQPKGILRTNVTRCENNREDGGGAGAAADVDDKQRRSPTPSVIARLMGLEQLPSSSIPVKKAELRRSASESRVSRDLSLQYRFMESGNNTQQQEQKHPSLTNIPSNSIVITRDNVAATASMNAAAAAALSRPMDPPYRNAPNRGLSDASPPLRKQYQYQQRKSFFDSADIFPEPKQTASSIYGEIEKRLKMRGIDGPSKDLETLKQILDALQLKGLLHSNKTPPSQQFGHNNLVYDANYYYCFDESPIMFMNPSSRTPISSISRRIGSESPPSKFRNNKPGARRNLNIAGDSVPPSISPRRERTATDQNARNPNRVRSETPVVKRTSSLMKPKPKSLSIETQRRVNEATEQRRVSPLHSAKVNSKRLGPDQDQATSTSRSPRTRNPVADLCPKEKITATGMAEDESSSISECTVSAFSQTDTERWKVEEYKEGRSLLERCDKLLHSIAEMNASNDIQPSPVSVLDSSSFYKDDSSSPSPVLKRSSIIDFKLDQSDDLEDEIWSPALSPVQSTEDSDYVYISNILRASHYLPEDSDVFLLLEKQQYLNGKETSKASRLQRKLIFDTITEILNRNRQLPPWKKVYAVANTGTTTKPLLQQIWSEFQIIREHDTANDLFEVICGVLKKDLAGDAISGWGDCPLEMSEAVLDIERLIFKDLVGETIRDLAARCAFVPHRRKLIF